MKKIFRFSCLSLLALTSFYFFSIESLASSLMPHQNYLSYTDSGKGTPLILIHPFPTDKRFWRPQQKLNKNFRMITVDLLGFGKSSPVTEKGMSMSQHAETIKYLLDHLHIQKAFIGGESMGGYIALALLKKYPQNIAGLILSNTQSIGDNAIAQEKREETAKEVLTAGTKNLVKHVLINVLTPEVSKPKRIFLENILKAQSPAAIASALRGMARRTDQSDVLAHTALPILIITGEKDHLIPQEESIKMHRLSKNSTLVIIPGAGHLSSLEKPQQWNQAVMRWKKTLSLKIDS